MPLAAGSWSSPGVATHWAPPRDGRWAPQGGPRVAQVAPAPGEDDQPRTDALVPARARTWPTARWPSSRIEVLHLLVESVEHLGGITAEQGVGAQRTAPPAHRVGGTKTAPDHIADHDTQPVRGKTEHVIPVAPNAAGFRRCVASGQLQAEHHRQLRRQQTSLQHRRRGPFDLVTAGCRGESNPDRPQSAAV
jgi:hypothetical protein